MNLSSRWLVLAGVAAFAQPQAPEPTIREPLIRVETRLVQVSVVVHDKNGAIVDLTKDDFTLTDRGKEQKIAFFSISSSRAAATPVEPLAANIFTNRPERYGSAASNATVVLFDALNTSFADQAYARKQILKFLEQLEPQDRVALYVLSNRIHVLQDFTSDPGRLRRAVQRQKGNNSAELQASEPEAANTGDPEVDQWLDHASGVIADFQIVNRAGRTLEAIETIANHIARVPGRKNLIWVSGSFPLTIGYDGPTFPAPGREQRTFSLEMQRAVRAVNNANVAVYPVDARGLIPPPIPQATRTGVRPVSFIPKNLDTMQELADRTGGRAFYNTNDLRGAIRTAIRDSEITYTLGFYPSADALDGKFHDLKVRVNRRGLDVRHRKGYFATVNAPPSDQQRMAEVRTALSSPLEATNIGLAARVEPSDQPRLGSLKVLISVDATNLTLGRKEDRWTGKTDVILVQRDREGKQLAATSETIDLNLKDETYKTALLYGIVFQKSVLPAEGLDQIRVVVVDRPTGQLGSLIVPAGGQ